MTLQKKNSKKKFKFSTLVAAVSAAAMLWAAIFYTTGCESSDVEPTLDITYNGVVDNELTIFNIPAEGGTYEITVLSNHAWSTAPYIFWNIPDGLLNLSPPPPNWYHISPDEGPADKMITATITVDPNEPASPDDYWASYFDGSERLFNFYIYIPEHKETIRTISLHQLAWPGVEGR